VHITFCVLTPRTHYRSLLIDTVLCTANIHMQILHSMHLLFKVSSVNCHYPELKTHSFELTYTFPIGIGEASRFSFLGTGLYPNSPYS
jgi:hypothetical protein